MCALELLVLALMIALVNGQSKSFEPGKGCWKLGLCEGILDAAG
jgi:hypothetical protein